MRVTILAAAAALALAGGASGALACDAVATGCPPSTVVWQRYTENGFLVGEVEAPVRHLPQLERSRFTGQPITVIYDHPGLRPGSVDPYLHLETLPRVRSSDTVGAYPVGY